MSLEETLSIKQRDTIHWETTLPDPETGEPYDLTDANEVRLYVEHNRTDILVVDSPVEILDEEAGKVAYDFSREETARSGTHYAEFEIDESTPERDDYTTVPDDGYARLDIDKMLNRMVDAEPVDIRGDWEVTRVTATESVRSPSGQFDEQLTVPVYSDDADAPRETEYFNSSDGELKYKDKGGGVHSGGGEAGLSPGEDFDGQGESSFTNLESVGVDRLQGDAVANHGLRSPDGKLEVDRVLDSGSIDNLIDTNRDGDIDFFVVAGQSNASGLGGDPSQAENPPAGVAYRVNYEGVEDITTLNESEINGSMIPAFAKHYNQITGRDVAFVQLGDGGSAQVEAVNESENWDPEGAAPNLYTESLETIGIRMNELESSGYNPNLSGILWSQGAQDANGIDSGTIDPATYRDTLAQMIRAYRRDLGDPNLRFFIFRSGTRTVGSTAGETAVRHAQNTVAATLENTYSVFEDAVEYPDEGKMDDSIHYNQTGLNEMGRQGGRAVSRIMFGDVRRLIKRGPTTAHNSYHGFEGELTHDTDKNVVVVHDNETEGGHPMRAEVGEYHAKAFLSANTSVPDGSSTFWQVPFDVADNEGIGSFDTADHLWVADEAGSYSFEVAVTLGGVDGGGACQLWIQNTTQGERYGYMEDFIPDGGAKTFSTSTSGTVQAGDEIGVYFEQQTDGSTALVRGDTTQTRFTITPS